MKKYFFLILFVSLLCSCSQDDNINTDDTNNEPPGQEVPNPPSSVVPCENGMAGNYPCNDYDLVSHIPLSVFQASAGNDSWGWTDPNTGKEYAIMGLDNGTAFVDISTPDQPIYIGKLFTQSNPSQWRDVKIYQNYAFVVSEANAHGMQVFDLNRLGIATDLPRNFQANAVYTGFGSAHNIVINEDTGFAYAVGTQTFDGGPHIVNIQNPLNPVAAGGFAMAGYTHDAQVVTYTGPDSDYTGREIYIGSNENEVVILDVTNKASIELISSISYDNASYTHQGWFTEDQKYFIVGDELDEIGIGFNTKTVVLDFTDLDSPQFHTNYTGPLASIDHNGYVKGNLYYLANYTGGMRVIDITNIENQTVTEVGFFDSFPSNDATTFNGAWNVYPYFASGNLVISDIDNGLFIVKKSN